MTLTRGRSVYSCGRDGRRLVGRALDRTPLTAWSQRAKQQCPKFLDASLALLGLLLAFTFSTALVKHDQRRLMVVADSNAIGDFYTCASLLKEPVRTRLRRVIHAYAVLRVNLSKRAYDAHDLEKALGQFQQMHNQMVELVSEALVDGTPLAVSLTKCAQRCNQPPG